nr:MAG TPA: hypothetical protein [Bacteriophage sp.]
MLSMNNWLAALIRYSRIALQKFKNMQQMHIRLLAYPLTNIWTQLQVFLRPYCNRLAVIQQRRQTWLMLQSRICLIMPIKWARIWHLSRMLTKALPNRTTPCLITLTKWGHSPHK